MKKLLVIILINTFLCISAYAAKNLYVSYKDFPKQVYKNQKFEIVVKALITTKNFESINTSFIDGNNIDVINPNSTWELISDNVYENRYYFKAGNGTFVLPSLEINILNAGNTVETSLLSPANISYSNIATKDKRFSNIIAKDLVLKAYKTKQYNNKESLTIIDIDAIDSNLEDFSLDNIEEQGVSNIKDEFPKQNLIYYFVMPVHKKKVIFNYYNTSTRSFVDITIPLILQNELVSTQTDLNPNDSNFEKYKKIAVAVIFVLFLLLYIWKRTKLYMYISIVLFIITALYLMPNRTGIVKKDSFVYILPTKNSTIFFKLENNQKVEVLNTKKDFIKVMGIDNKFIGWIKEENFGKN